VQGLVLSLMKTVRVAPRVVQGDENIPRSLLTMVGDALDFLNEPDAIMIFVALGLVGFQRLQFGLHHGAAVSPHDGVLDGSGVTFQEVDLFYVYLHRRLPNHLLSHLFVILF
jgi:hypothetical protein